MQYAPLFYNSDRNNYAHCFLICIQGQLYFTFNLIYIYHFLNGVKKINYSKSKSWPESNRQKQLMIKQGAMIGVSINY